MDIVIDFKSVSLFFLTGNECSFICYFFHVHEYVPIYFSKLIYQISKANSAKGQKMFLLVKICVYFIYAVLLNLIIEAFFLISRKCKTIGCYQMNMIYIIISNTFYKLCMYYLLNYIKKKSFYNYNSSPK